MNPRMVALSGTGQVSGAERVLVRALVAATEAGWRVSCLAPPGRMTEELAGAGVAHAATTGSPTTASGSCRSV